MIFFKNDDVNKKIIISISAIIIITIIGISITQIDINDNESTKNLEQSDDINSMLEKIKNDKINNDNSENPYVPKEREWIESGPFLLDRSEYWIGEKMFININHLDEKIKGEMVFAKYINSTHMYEYKKIPFDGSNPQQNFYLALTLNKARGICTPDIFIGDWELIFRGTNYESIKFEVLDEFIPGQQDNYKPVC